MQDEGEYSCEADNLVGSITARGSLVVHCTCSIPLAYHPLC